MAKFNLKYDSKNIKPKDIARSLWDGIFDELFKDRADVRRGIECGSHSEKGERLCKYYICKKEQPYEHVLDVQYVSFRLGELEIINSESCLDERVEEIVNTFEYKPN